MGTIVQQVDYLPYGEKCNNSTLISGENDYLYGGKEFQAPLFNIPWYDSQVRFQTTDGMFVSLDPLCEKYYSISPYAFCAGNPVKLVDKDGNSTYVKEEEPNKYSVVDGGDPNDGDNNIYVVEMDSEGIYQRTGDILGTTATPYSFYNTDEEKWVVGALIDLNYDSGNRYLESVENQEISLADYIKQAKEGELLDFKVTNYEESNIGRTVSEEYKYRGMIINDGSRRVIASARDVGNIAAGYVSGVKHIPYCAHRIACDYYESISNGGYRTFEGNLYVKWSLEGKSSRLPQRVGWEMGKRQRRKKK